MATGIQFSMKPFFALRRKTHRDNLAIFTRLSNDDDDDNSKKEHFLR